MLRTAGLMFFLAAFTLTAAAQSAKISAAVLEYEDGNYMDCLKLAHEGVANPSSLKPHRLARGYAYIARSLMALYTIVAKLPEDKQAAGVEELNRRYPTLLQDAYDALNKAKQADPSTVEDPNLVQTRLILGRLLLVMAQDEIFAESADLRGAITCLDHAEVLFKDVQMEDRYYVLNFLRGLARMRQAGAPATSAAIRDFEQTIAYYKKTVDLAAETFGENSAEVFELKADPPACGAYAELIALYANYEKDMSKARQLANERPQRCDY